MDCSVCGLKEAIYSRPYSGERFCGKCFSAAIEKQTRRTISRYNMLERNDRIAVAVSGGKDSLSLLYILREVEKEFPSAHLHAIAVDEGIAGYREEALSLAEENCKALGVPLTRVSFQELYGITLDEIARRIRGVDGELTPCSYCGVMRRRALNEAARRVGATKQATAHNLDDEVQTILLNIIHGGALRAFRVVPVMAPSHYKFIPRVKPFCETLECELALYAYLREIRFQTVRCPYASMALRTEVRNFLNSLELRHPGSKYTIYRSIERLRSMLRTSVIAELGECRECGEPTTGEVCEVCRMLERLRTPREPISETSWVGG
ncbi:MAG: TIGR00269 family protein [Candidatus Bathyarchaeia archaeon]